MLDTADLKPLTLRLRPDVYQAAANLARRRSQSLNSLIQESLALRIKVEEDRELFEAAELLGQFPDECNVEYAFAAQAEAALRVEFDNG